MGKHENLDRVLTTFGVLGIILGIYLKDFGIVFASILPIITGYPLTRLCYHYGFYKKEKPIT